MHRIYDRQAMQDKADAIRYACNLPASEKMKPPEMADKLLQYAGDPGLVYTVNNYITPNGNTIPSVRLLHSAFDTHQAANIDLDLYNKLMVTFNIHECSVKYNDEYSITDLNNGINEGTSSASASNPLRPLLYLRPIIRIDVGNDTNWTRNKMSTVDIYHSNTEGLVYTFSKYGRSIVSTSSSYMANYVERKVTDAADKDVSIIFYKNNPNTYSVLVDGEFAFSLDRVGEDIIPETSSTHFSPFEDIGCLEIGDVYYGVYNGAPGLGESVSDALSNDYVYGHGRGRDSYNFPFGYNQSCDITYNSVTIKYVK